MLKIYKYPIPIKDHFELMLPEKARILYIDEQFGIPQLWALVDPSAPTTLRRFRFSGTGHPIEEPASDLIYCGTFKMEGGILIFHVFEHIKPSVSGSP